MSVQPLTWDDFEEAQQQGPEPTVLSGWRLWSARVLWALVMLVTVGLFAASIKPYFDFVLFFPKFWFSSPDYAPALEQLSLTAGFYHGYLIALQVLQVLVCLVIAALIFKNKSDDWLALFVSLTLVAYAASQGDQIGALLLNAPELRYAALPALTTNDVPVTEKTPVGISTRKDESAAASASGFTENTPVGIFTKNEESSPWSGPFTSKAASPSGISTYACVTGVSGSCR